MKLNWDKIRIYFLTAKDLTKKHSGVMYLRLGQICGGGGAPVMLVAAWMANGRGVDGGL
jgi:hypothetical protein